MLIDPLQRNSYKHDKNTGKFSENLFQHIICNILAFLCRHTYINSYPPIQNGRYFANDNFRCIFVNEIFCILIQISLKFVPNGLAPNRRQAITRTNVDPVHWRIYATLGEDELSQSVGR